MKSTFKILFYLKRGAIRANGCALIMGRITVDGVGTQFSTKLDVKRLMRNSPWMGQPKKLTKYKTTTIHD